MNRSARLLFVPCLCLPALAQQAMLVSVDSADVQGNAPSTRASLSADGRYIAFESDAANLAANDTNGVTDVFVHDRQTGTTKLISVDPLGMPATFGGSNASISADGRFVAFESDSFDILPSDANGWTDVFVRDLMLGTTDCASIDSQAMTGNHVSRAASISADGRFVAFESRASSLVANDTNFTYDVFVHDRLSLVTWRVSVDSSGIEGNSISRAPSISGDGRFVAFESFASNLVANDTNGLGDVFVHDRQTGTTTRVSLSSGGAEGDLQSLTPSFSRDGRFVAFESEATNFAAGDLNGGFDVFVRDLTAGTTLLGSASPGGSTGGGSSFQPALSGDGRYLVYAGYAPNVPEDDNLEQDVYVRDLQLGRTVIVSVTPDSKPLFAPSTWPAISDDGLVVAYTSLSAEIVPADVNAAEDVFATARPPAYEAVCVGDGAGAACPCGNASPAESQAGCAHSFGEGGRLWAFGIASIANDTLVLRGRAMPDSSALYFQGQTAIGSGLGTPFGDGLRCAGGAIVRLGTKTNASGASEYPSGADASVSVRGSCAPGASHVYQVWYRNAASFCTASTFNLTNGVRLTWLP